MAPLEIRLPPETSAPVNTPAADMNHLAQLVRALLSLSENLGPIVPLGGALFDVVLFAAGPQGDAVVRALDELQQPHGCGPVIADPDAAWLCALVPPGTSKRSWSSPYGCCIGAGRVRLPPMHLRTPPGMHWLRPTQTTHLVGPVMLAQALGEYQPGPAPDGPPACGLFL